MLKVDLGVQQYLGEFGLSYRILQAPRGWFDILGGFRFTYLGNQMGLQADQGNINAASTDLSETVHTTGNCARIRPQHSHSANYSEPAWLVSRP